MTDYNKIQQIQINNTVYEVQGKSVENQNTALDAFTDKYDWVGTVEEYEEQQISTLHPEWVCYIIDDVKGNDGGLDLSDYVRKDVYELNDENTVHKAGSETIVGTKTFVDNDSQVALATKSTTIDDEVTPVSESQRSNAINNCDINGVVLSKIYTLKKPDGSNGICLQAIKGNSQYMLGVDSSGNSIAPHPAASSSTSHINIATVGWVNDATKSTNVVHRSDSEEISGVKTFTAGGHTIKIRRANDIDWTDIRTEKEDGTRTGGFRNIAYNNGQNNETNMYVTSNDGTTIIGTISVDTDGTNAWTQAPASDITNSIVTTTGISKGQNGYVKFGNGLIIQWGITPAITTQGQTVNLPTAFTSTDYSVTATMNLSGGSDNCSCHTRTTTSFKMNVGATGNTYNFIAIGY